MAVITYTGRLVTESCAVCGIGFAMPEELELACQRDHSRGFYCPLGHSLVFLGKTIDQQLAEAQAETRRIAERERIRVQALNDQLSASERSRSAIKGQVTKLRKRIGNGVCPVDGCHRHFANVEAHIHRMHPQFEEQGL